MPVLNTVHGKCFEGETFLVVHKTHYSQNFRSASGRAIMYSTQQVIQGRKTFEIGWKTLKTINIFPLKTFAMYNSSVYSTDQRTLTTNTYSLLAIVQCIDLLYTPSYAKKYANVMQLLHFVDNTINYSLWYSVTSLRFSFH